MSMPASDGRFDAVVPNLRPYEEAPACFCTSDIRQRAPPPVLLLLGKKAPGRLRQHACGTRRAAQLFVPLPFGASDSNKRNNGRLHFKSWFFLSH
jgi:hypothetical protein